MLKLLNDHAYQNDAAFETLDRFFPAWTQDVKNLLSRLTEILEKARRDAEEKRRAVTVMGSVLDERIAQAKAWYEHARKRKKKRPAEVEEYKEALAAAMRPKTEYQAALKEVKRLETQVKQAKAAVERGGKIITAYENLTR